MTFLEKNYEHCKNVLSKDTIEYIKNTVHVHETANLMISPPTIYNPYPFGDEQSPNSFSWYAPIHTEALLRMLKPKFSEISELNLLESYSYYRVYYNGAPLVRHIDRASCEYSATVCIEKGSTPWPIFFEDIDKNVIEIEMDEGDVIFYKGNILPHWRNDYTGDRHVQFFLHYVNADGPYGKTNLYDGRPYLAFDGNTKVIESQHFAIDRKY